MRKKELEGLLTGMRADINRYAQDFSRLSYRVDRQDSVMQLSVLNDIRQQMRVQQSMIDAILFKMQLAPEQSTEEKLKELHYAGKISGFSGEWCYECSDLEGGRYVVYPCETIRTLDGNNEQG
jgi:hypothetical protein